MPFSVLPSQPNLVWYSVDLKVGFCRKNTRNNINNQSELEHSSCIFLLLLGGVCLLHTTQGELLRRFEAPQTSADRLRPCSVFNGISSGAAFGGSPMRVLASRHGYVIFQLGATKIAVFTLNARLVAVTDLHRQVI